MHIAIKLFSSVVFFLPQSRLSVSQPGLAGGLPCPGADPGRTRRVCGPPIGCPGHGQGPVRMQTLPAAGYGAGGEVSPHLFMGCGNRMYTAFFPPPIILCLIPNSNNCSPDQ